MRVLTYNLHSLRDDAGEAARVIRGARPDVACLQEAPRFVRWRAKRSRLLRSAGLRQAVGERRAGLAIAVDPCVRVVHTGYRLLSPIPGLHRRGLALAVLDVRGARLVAACVHLDLATAPRSSHAAEILRTVDEIGSNESARDAAIVLAGDMNEVPGEPAWAAFVGRFIDAFAVAPSGAGETYGSRRIDAIFVSPAVRVLAAGVPEPRTWRYEAASDHRPVVADLMIGD